MEIQMTTQKPDITMSLNGKLKVTFEVDKGKLDAIQGLPDKVLDMTIKDHREKRSLDANAYCFVLIGKLAEKLGIPKDEVYRNAIREISSNYITACYQDKDIEQLKATWERNGLGWQVETFPSKVKGCTNVNMYYGSSVFDSKQMSQLLDGIIEDCKAVGIETRTPQEIEDLKSLWKQ